jgi:hypothetical protein
MVVYKYKDADINAFFEYYGVSLLALISFCVNYPELVAGSLIWFDNSVEL